MRLVRIGFPLSEAVGMIHQKQKEGHLEEFVRELETEYKRECEKYVKEVIG